MKLKLYHDLPLIPFKIVTKGCAYSEITIEHWCVDLYIRLGEEISQKVMVIILKEKTQDDGFFS